MDEFLKSELDAQFQKRYAVKRKYSYADMAKVVTSVSNYGYLSALDDVFELFKDQTLDKDLLLGEVHLLAKKRLEGIPGERAKAMDLNWIIDYSKTGDI